MVGHQLVGGLGGSGKAFGRAFAHFLSVVVRRFIFLEVAAEDVLVAPVIEFLARVDLARHRGADRIARGGDGAQLGGGAPAADGNFIEQHGLFYVCGGGAAAGDGHGQRQCERVGRFHGCICLWRAPGVPAVR